MEKQTWLEKAEHLEGKADKAETLTLKLKYRELARNYRKLAGHAERTQGLSRIQDAAR